jgi:hypothetical protein
MERLLLLWDELDELACWGRQLAIGLASLVKWPAVLPSLARRPGSALKSIS